MPAGLAARTGFNATNPRYVRRVPAGDSAGFFAAIAALNPIGWQVLAHDLHGRLRALQDGDMPFEICTQRRYNPEGI